MGEITNTIDPNIKVTIDSPSCNSNGKVPILDIEVWVENNRINHSFYRKPIASQFLIMKRSAMSANTKRNTLFQEGLKRVTYTRGGAMIEGEIGNFGERKEQCFTNYGKIYINEFM